MSGAREAILERVRAATRDVPASERPEDVAVERGYRHDAPGSREELIERFAERVADYRATVLRVGASELAEAIRSACAERGARRVVVPGDLPAEWRAEGIEWLEDDGLTPEALDAADGVVTGCAVGIAETGTFVLDAGAHQGRRALTLLPDLHVCVVREDQVVGSMPEGIARLGDTVRGAGRPITFISGPSATSDIELNRVEGVHGPRTLVVLIVSGD
jgi:L-lactate dehydrogenase complex protein LldG